MALSHLEPVFSKDINLNTNSLGYCTGYRYVNNTIKPLFICDRLGRWTRLEPNRLNHLSNHFFIESFYQTNLGVTFDTKDSIYQLEDEALKFAYDELKANPMYNTPKHLDFRNKTLGFETTLDAIESGLGAHYLKAFDVVITARTDYFTFTHPTFSREFTTAVQSNQDVGLIGLQCKVVDNRQRFKDLFLNINAEVYKVTPVVDPLIKDGVYVSKAGLIDTNGFPIRKPVEYHDFDNLGNIKLYTSQQEAIENAYKSEYDEERIKEKEREHKLKVIELEERKSVLEAENHEFKLRFDALMKEKELERKTKEAELKMKQAEQNDYYESRSHERKDSSEIIKWIPAVIAGAIALFSLKRS